MEFGKKSKEKLLTCHSDIQKVFNLAISRSQVDFGVSEGHRSINTQKEYYSIGRTTQMHRDTITNVDGVTKLGKHNELPSLAIDIYIWHPEKKTRNKIRG